MNEALRWIGVMNQLLFLLGVVIYLLIGLFVAVLFIELSNIDIPKECRKFGRDQWASVFWGIFWPLFIIKSIIQEMMSPYSENKEL